MGLAVTKICINDYPKLKLELSRKGVIWLIHNNRVVSNELARLLGQYDITADVYPNDPFGTFWLSDKDATKFILKWS